MRSSSRFWSVLLFAALLFVAPLAGLAVIKIHGPQIERDAIANLEAIASLKNNQLESWLAERYNDSVVLMSSETLRARVAELRQTGDAGLRESVLSSLVAAVDQVQYHSVLLLDPEGRALAMQGAVTVVEAEIVSVLAKALESGRPQMSEFIADEDGGTRLGVVVPLIDNEHGFRNPLGAIVLHVRPDDFLFPYIQGWPTVSTSGETLLVRRDGDALLSLNKLRHRQAAALSLRVPMTRTDLVGVAALSAMQPGSGRGLDYRGVPVFAAYRPVGETGWMIVAKIDRDEVMAPLHDLALWICLIALFAIVSVSVTMLMLWRQRQRTDTLQMEVQSGELLRRFYDMPFIGIAVRSANSDYWTMVNDQLCTMLGRSREELLGMRWQELSHPEDITVSNAGLERIARGETDDVLIEKRFINKDGSTIYTKVDLRCLRDAEGLPENYFAVFHDVSEGKASEARILRLKNMYAALSECNQAIVHSNGPEDLFPLVCRSAVKYGGMKLARISLMDADSTVLRTVASFGEESQTLGEVPVSADANSPFGGGGTGTAVREGRPVWVQDFINDPMTKTWHERGRLEGWRSSAALPLTRDGVVIGALRLYSGEVNAFDEEIRNLLEEMATDISFALSLFAKSAERARAEEELRLAAKVFEQSAEGVVISDPEHKILKVNRAFSVITGYEEAEVLGQDSRLLAADTHDEHQARAMLEIVRQEGYWQGELLGRRKDGSLFAKFLSISRVIDADGNISHNVGIFSDISEQKASQAHIQQLAHYDALTGLPNRSLLEDRVGQAISRVERSGETLALVFLDLDRFKNVNDSLGHRVGDELLIEVAKRLKSALRDEDTVSRLGGDEFILVLPGSSAEGAAHVAEKVMRVLSQPYSIEQHELSITPSLGIAMYPDDGTTYEALSMCADAAMYRAKQGGRHTFRFFTREMQERSDRALLLENALRRALELDQLQLHYQPQISLEDNRVIGVEALLRWVHPELGWVSPADFIPVAEDSGLILPIGEWVLRAAVRQMKIWQDSSFCPPMVMAVNLSAVQFRQESLSRLVTGILEEAGLPPDCLELELTEGVAMDDPQLAIAVMNDLHAHKIRLSIDDFGTGYSSLSYLKRFKVYKLKIDQSFVRDILNDPDDRAIVEAIIGLARNLGVRTIAEGVETAEQMAFLYDRGCDEAQGYFIAKPMPAGEFEGFVRNFKLLG